MKPRSLQGTINPRRWENVTNILQQDFWFFASVIHRSDVSYPQIWRRLSTDLTGPKVITFFFWDTSPPRQHRLNGTVDARRCHWLATSAPFTAKESRVFRMASKQRWAPQSTCDAPKEIETESHLHKIQSNCWLPCIDFYSFPQKIVCV